MPFGLITAHSFFEVMYGRDLVKTPRSHSPIIPRSWLRRQRAWIFGGCSFFLLWQTVLSPRTQVHYPQFTDTYNSQVAGLRNRPIPQYHSPDPKSYPEQNSEEYIGSHIESTVQPQTEGIERDHEHDNDESLISLNHDFSNQEPVANNRDPNWNPDGSLYQFPSYQDWLDIDAKADTLPDLVHIPLENAVQDEILAGWEDEWFASGEYDRAKWGVLQEPLVDFIYTWVNGSQQAFADTMRPYEINSTLNDRDGEWLRSHGSNRYRSWDELRYSIRSVEKYASDFMNKIQIVVNAVDESANPEVGKYTKQRPVWLREDAEKDGVVEVLSQEEFFGDQEKSALPSFNSLAIESQLWNTPSSIDRFFALSDDMLLGRPHAAADIYSPLFGPALGFKSNGYNTRVPPDEMDARRFGEKPFLIYTSWLLNRRFGIRKRKGQVHHGHSMSRSVAREVRDSFPRPSLISVSQRFRGETGFQLYTWYAAFHYTVERHREALLNSYIVHRADTNGDGNLNWSERRQIMADLAEGMIEEGNDTYRKRMFSRVAEFQESAGLAAPKVNTEVLWTSLDGPMAIRDLDCFKFDVNECLSPGFSAESSDKNHVSPVFNTALIFDRLARQDTLCGDCFLKLILNRQSAGLEPLLPPKDTMQAQREITLKALKRYQYSVVQPDAMFMMVTDAEQVQYSLIDRLVGADASGEKRQVGQLCLNDDVVTSDKQELKDLQDKMVELFQGLLPEPSRFENDIEHFQNNVEEVLAQASQAKERNGVEQSVDRWNDGIVQAEVEVEADWENQAQAEDEQEHHQMGGALQDQVLQPGVVTVVQQANA